MSNMNGTPAGATNKPIVINSDLNPVDWYNKTQFDHAQKVMLKHKNFRSVDGQMYELNDDGEQIAEIVKLNDCFLSAEGAVILDPEEHYTPFMIFAKLKFKNDWHSCAMHIEYTILKKAVPYIRVGGDYFKQIKVVDRFSIERIELKRWKKETIIDDHGKPFLKGIPKFNNFTLQPDNISYNRSINGNYNLYNPFPFRPKEGEWIWIERMLRHVFGEQYELGLRYMQILYRYPKQQLPVLVLGSRERQTAKSTFLDFLSLMFGANCTVVGVQDIDSQFNGSYGLSNIIGIEETSDDRKHLMNKLKMLSTTKFITMNQKFIDNYKVPFFGKLVITTNTIDRFLQVETPEIRYWLRELGVPLHTNHNILEDMVNEVPAFIDHLLSMEEPNLKISRMAFSPEEIYTSQLDLVKKESMSWLYKELCEKLQSYYDNNQGLDEIEFTAADIKTMWFENNYRAETNYIRRVLKQEFGLTTSEVKRYQVMGKSSGLGIHPLGRVFTVTREFIENVTEYL